MSGMPPDAVRRDDLVLDVLASGARPVDPDPVVQALYAWRTHLSEDVEALVRPATARGVARVTAVGRVTAAGRVNAAGGVDAAGRVNGTAKVNGVSRPDVTTRIDGAARHLANPSSEEPDDDATATGRRPGRRRAAVAAIVVGLSGGLGGVAAAAADAEPGSPLWPITKVIYPDAAADRQAERDAEAALAKAREALADGRVDDAERYLDEADRRAGSAGDETGALRDEVEAMRERLTEAEDGGPGTPTTAPSPDGSSGSDDGNPLPTPALPTPSIGGGSTDRSTPDKGREEDRDAPADKQRSDGTSSDLQLSPDASLTVSSLPEF